MASQYFIGPSGGGSSSAGSSGAKNYLGTVNSTNLNGDFELGTTAGWSLGNVSLTSNLPTGTPTFGSGASGNLSISAVTSGKLAGTYSLSYASSAATTAGDLLASDAFTIDTEDQAKVMTFCFYYSPTSNPSNGNWSGTTSNSFGVAIYDVTNSAWIIPAGVFSMTQSSGVGYATGTFQTTSNSTQYRFCVYNANASAGAITVLFDDMFLGPETAPIGAVVTDWQSWTPTGSWVSNATYTGQWRVVGGDYEYEVNVAVTGTPTNAALTINLPSGHTIDTARLLGTPTAASNPVFGQAIFVDSGVQAYPGIVVYNSTTSVYAYAQGSASTYVNVAALSNSVPLTWANADSAMIRWRVPISGKSSNVQLSNDTDTRVVAFRAYRATNQTGVNPNNSNVQMQIDTVSQDTHGGFNTGTYTYTIPVSGYYVFTTGITVGATNVLANNYAPNVFRNGASIESSQRYTATASTGFVAGAVTSPTRCNAGDTITLYLYGAGNNSASTLTVTGDAGVSTWFAGHRLSGPAVVAATENVAFYAYRASSQSSVAPNNSSAKINVDTVSFDTHNAFSTANNRYVAPVSGYYVISGAASVNSTNVLNNSYAINFLKNGSQLPVCSRITVPATTGFIVSGTIGPIYLNAGDYVEMYLFGTGNNSVSTLTVAGDAGLSTWFSGFRLKN